MSLFQSHLIYVLTSDIILTSELVHTIHKHTCFMIFRLENYMLYKYIILYVYPAHDMFSSTTISCPWRISSVLNMKISASCPFHLFWWGIIKDPNFCTCQDRRLQELGFYSRVLYSTTFNMLRTISCHPVLKKSSCSVLSGIDFYEIEGGRRWVVNC